MAAPADTWASDLPCQHRLDETQSFMATTVAMFMASLLGREDRNQTGGQSAIQLTTLVALQMVVVAPTFLENIFCNKQVK